MTTDRISQTTTNLSGNPKCQTGKMTTKIRRLSNGNVYIHTQNPQIY